MFKVSFLGGKIASDEGFTVTFVGRFAIKYEEGTRHVLIASEGDGKELDLFHSSIKTWISGDKLESIDDASDKRIVDNVCRALEARGLYVRVVT